MKWLLFLVFLTSCTLYPRYERPSLEEPTGWRETPETKNAVDVGWWQQFGDSALDGLIDAALANNQDLQVAIARVDQFQADLLVAKSKLYPQVSGDLLSQRQKISSSVTALPPGIKQVFNLFGFIFNASYLVDLWGEVRSGVDAAYHAWLSAIEARRVVVLGLVSSVASTYVQLRQFDEQLIIGNETLRTREESLYLARIRFELGLTSDLQVEQAISEVESAKVEVENLQIQVAQTENLLSFLIGSPSREIPRGLTLGQATMPPSIPAVLPSDLLNQRPDIKVAEERLMSLNANIGVAKAKFFPQINLQGAAGAESVKLNQLFTKKSKIWAFGSTIMQDIFTGFDLTGNLDLARAQKEEAVHAYLSAVLNGFKEVNDALVAHRIYLEQVEIEEMRVEALEKYLHLSDLRYKEGQTDYLTYLDAERQLFRGLLELESAKANSFLSYIQIYQALGGGWVVQADDQAVDRE